MKKKLFVPLFLFFFVFLLLPFFFGSKVQAGYEEEEFCDGSPSIDNKYSCAGGYIKTTASGRQISTGYECSECEQEGNCWKCGRSTPDPKDNCNAGTSNIVRSYTDNNCGDNSPITNCYYTCDGQTTIDAKRARKWAVDGHNTITCPVIGNTQSLCANFCSSDGNGARCYLPATSAPVDNCAGYTRPGSVSYSCFPIDTFSSDSGCPSDWTVSGASCGGRPEVCCYKSTSSGANQTNYESCTTHSQCGEENFCISNVKGQKGSSSCVSRGQGGPNALCEDYTAQGSPVNLVCASGKCNSSTLRCEESTGGGGTTGGGANPDTTSCEAVAGTDGSTFQCQVGPSCTAGGTPYSGQYSGCPASKPTCCKFPPSGGGTGTGGSTPTETCKYYGVSCKNTTDANDVVKENSSETAPYKSGNQCGGNYHDVYECTNNTTGAKRLEARPVPASNAVCAPGGSWCAVSTNPCQSRGGLMGGVQPVPKCGNTAYNAAEANKTQTQGNPYCGQAYSVDYQCSDGTWEPRTTGYAANICNESPWCNTLTGSGTGGTSTGTGESCSGAPSAVGGNCPAAKPICNRSGTTGDCVAQASVPNGQYCAKAPACQSGICNSYACAAPTAPTPPPLSLDIYCPVIDTDGRASTCHWNSDCPAGYAVKSSDIDALSNKACSQHTSGQYPWCCHKDATSTGNPATGGALSPACPNVDTDGRPNSCVDKSTTSNPSENCPAGYSYKNAAQGDSDCSEFRGKPSVCCHQGSGT